MTSALILAIVLPASAAPTRIGAAGAVAGSVTAAAPELARRSLASGGVVYHKDAVATGPAGRLQVMLLDETVFTVGPASEVLLDEFVYDPFTDAGEVSARVTKGVFRFVTGKVARRKPEGMKVKLPVGTVGIRGTIAAGKVEGDSALIALLGPGRGNNADERPGGITVENAGVSVDIDEPGMATRIPGPGEPPTPPFPLTPEMLAELSPTPPAEGDDEGAPAQEGSAEQEAGQETAAARETSGESIDLGEEEESLAETTAFAAQDAATGGAFTWEDLRAAVQSGTAFYDGQGTYVCGGACSGSGLFALHFNVDFGARTIGGPSPNTSHFAFVSGPLLASPETPGSNIPLTSFAALTGEAKLVQGVNYSGSDSNFNGSGFSFNSGGSSVSGSLVYDNGSSNATGSVTSSCVSGPCP